MSGKYSGLPDIDSAPDVFETPDEPDLSPHKEDEINDDAFRPAPASPSKDIDTTALPTRNVVGKQFGSVGEGDVITLPPENRLARLRRLQAEISELESEIGKEGGSQPTKTHALRPSVLPPRSKFDMVSELSSLRTRLSLASETLEGGGIAPPSKQDAEWLERLRRLEAVSPDQVNRPPPPVDGPHPPVSEVDKRLAALENMVGVATAADEGIPVSLMDSLSRLDNLLNVLTQPRHLDGISRRVKMLLNDLERAGASARRNAGAGAGSSTDKSAPSTMSRADQDTLQTLFALLPRLDPLLPTIPPLITRLRSLSGLHAEALGIAADLRELQSSLANASDEERELNIIVSSVQSGLSDAAVGIERNWEALQSRVESLEGRLQKLG